MGWLHRLDRLIGRIIAAAQWLALPLDPVVVPAMAAARHRARLFAQANDLGQIIFALFVAVSVTAATRAGTHLAADTAGATLFARARGTGCKQTRRRHRPAAMGAVRPDCEQDFVLQSVFGLEDFPDTNNPGYFVIKLALWLMAS